MSGDSISFKAFVKSSTLFRKLLTWPLANSPTLRGAGPPDTDSMCAPRLNELPLGAATDAHQETDQCADEKHHEQYFRDTGRTGRDAAKTEESGNQRDDEEDHGIVKHDRTS